MSKKWKSAVAVLVVFLLLAAAFASGFYIGKNQRSSSQQNVDGNGFEVPILSEKCVITVEAVKLKLIEIGELATYSGEYSVTISDDSSRYFLDDIRVPLTKKTITIEARGITKVGFDIYDVNVEVDSASEKIYIKLPEIKVLDNYVIWDSIKCQETNNILNPIDFDDYQRLISEIEENGRVKAEEEGIFKLAEENAQLVISNFLAVFDEYEIIFM